MVQKTVSNSKKRIGKRYRKVQKIKKIRRQHRMKMKASRSRTRR